MRLYSGARKGFGRLYVLPVANSLEMGENGKDDKSGRESSYNRGLCDCLSTAKDLNALTPAAGKTRILKPPAHAASML